ncbi:hypothetical protein H8E88_02535 [candidate division KSB1 bacterium]|nr:hypothetical protein [candidate division KSB1 bacterium]
MKTTFLSKLVYEDLVGGKYIKLYLPFSYYSEILKQIIVIPAGFICDKESVPVIKPTSARGGVIHDYFCRKDSVPVVTKQMAADLYLEAQVCRDEMLNEGRLKGLNRTIRRNVKTLVVRIAPWYFHKLKVLEQANNIIER